MRRHVDVIVAAVILVALLLLTHAAQHQPDPGTVRPAQHGTTSQVVAP